VTPLSSQSDLSVSSPRCIQVDQWNHVIRAINITTLFVSTLAGQRGIYSPFINGVGTVATFNMPSCIAFINNDGVALIVSLIFSSFSSTSFSSQTYGSALVYTSARVMFCLQSDTDNFLIRAINVSSGAVVHVAGQLGSPIPFSNGIGTTATFNKPYGIAVSGDGTIILVVG
jgi:hypothetical protein